MSVKTMPSTRFSEVLFATDFSEESDRALSYAKSIVRASGGELILVHVAQLPAVIALSGEVWVDDSVRINAEEEQTQEAAGALRAEGLKVRAFCPFGAVGQRVAQSAEIHHADLVVVGTHGRRGLNRVIFGSYTEETAGSLETPLLIIGPRVPLATQTAWKPTRILVPTSFFASDAALVAFACSLAKTHGASLDILTDTRDRANSQWLEFRKSVSKLVDLGGADELPLHTSHLPEPIAKSLIEAVIARATDLLVIGCENRKWLTLHEGTLQELLADVPCPILTFPTTTN